MEKEENNYSAFMPPSNFNNLDYTLDHHQEDQQMLKSRIDETNSSDNNNGMVNYLMYNHHQLQQQQQQQQQQQISTQLAPAGFCGSTSTSFDKLSFADVMQFADFGQKLALNQSKISEEEPAIDPVYFLKFPVLNDKLDNNQDQSISLMVPQAEERFTGLGEEDKTKSMEEEQDEEGRVSGSNNSVQKLHFLGEDHQNNPRGGGVQPEPAAAKNKRKRPRTTKTTQEVESQRMTHIAVERNRRKQMNEHLRVLRSLMPGSYVQRGDQASIIGGAIEFVRELEQLLQCLESQKRRRLLGEAPPRQVGDSATAAAMAVQAAEGGGGPLIFPAANLSINNPNDPIKFVDYETGLREETAENKSCFADVEVKVLGFDAMIKILSQRRPGQLIKAIAALEDLQLNILHTNITTIEQTVLYSFNVKVGSESRFTAEDIASSVQQIFSFIHANTASM
ncbi:LOW QUALITY PROTEIN: transcription factor FAMA [Pyrus x bretschneideri]|uniref:LOW QUALITY PROTEIN: transcription factor FAMA n=1 Tax=Pyrus x bretschneideri TaxID=225117 RepID=UPI00202FBFF1|nr:LOW QUALITY PROTEIN: transcription factor FAMA [Pyrus x bretschneideri]